MIIASKNFTLAIINNKNVNNLTYLLPNYSYHADDTGGTF